MGRSNQPPAVTLGQTPPIRGPGKPPNKDQGAHGWQFPSFGDELSFLASPGGRSCVRKQKWERTCRRVTDGRNKF